MERRRRPRIQTLVGGLTAGLMLVGCATSRGSAPGVVTGTSGPGRCEALVESLRYAEKSVGGRVAATLILGPIGLGLGLIGAIGGRPDGILIPVELIAETAKAAKENKQQFGRIREACQMAGGPDTVAVAQTVRDFARLRVGQKSLKDATRLYRDALAVLDRAGAAESEEAATLLLELAATLEQQKAPAAEVEGLQQRARAIRERGIEQVPRDPVEVF